MKKQVIFLSLTLSLVLCIAGISLAQASNINSTNISETQYLEDLAYVTRLAAGSSDQGIYLDLADDAQYRFVLYRLQQSGKNEQNSPHLFAQLRLLRQKHLRGEGRVPTDVAGGNLRHFDHLVSGVLTRANYASVHALVTARGGTDYSYLDLYITDPFGSPSGFTDWAEESGDGRFLEVSVLDDVSFPDSPLSGMFNANSLFYGEVAGSNPLIRFFSAPLAQVRALSISHPFDTKLDNQPIVGEQVVNKLCLQSVNTSCDYSNYGDTSVHLPFRGSAVVSFPAIYTPTLPLPEPFALAGAYIRLTDEAYGGTIGLQTSLEPYLEAADLGQQGDYRLFQISWDIPQQEADFGAALFAQREQVDWLLNIPIRLQIMMPNGAAVTITQNVAVSNKTLPGNSPNSAPGAARPLTFRNN